MKNSRGQKYSRVQQKHCSSLAPSDLKNLLNKKVYVFIYLLVHSVFGTTNLLRPGV